MSALLARLRAVLDRGSVRPSPDGDACEVACAWDEMRATYREQAARGVPEAIVGLERIEQGRWPSSGRPRER